MRFLNIKTFVFGSIFLIIGSGLFIAFANHNGGLQSYFGQSFKAAELDNYLKKKMQDYDIPGLSFAVISEGKVSYESYQGFANKEQKLPVTKDTLFESASISKPVFASFVMQHLEKGLIDLDKPLVEYYPVKYIEDERYKQITARMALSHQAGWPNWRWDRKDKQLKFIHSPGETYRYSGEGYQYLADTLRHIHAGDWQKLENKFQEWIAQPLNMQNSTFTEPYPVAGLKAQPYDENSQAVDFIKLPSYQRNIGVYVAAASLVTNVEDLSKWMLAVINGELMSPELQNEMLKPQVGTGQSLITEVMYTLGFFELKVPGLVKVYGHGGNNHGFTGFFALDAEKQWGFVVLTNSEYGEQLGAEALGYLLTGPNIIPYLIILLALVLLLFTLLFWLFRALFRTIKQSR